MKFHCFQMKGRWEAPTSDKNHIIRINPTPRMMRDSANIVKQWVIWRENNG